MDDSSSLAEEAQFPAAAILLVDDHRPNLLALEVVLEPLGHQLVLAESARDALRLAAEREFAVIVTDVRMPGLDGFDLVERLRARTRAPVVMMSAVYDDRETVRRAYSLGAVDFIAKPFDPDLVRWRVGALASLYRRGEELKRRAALITEAVAEADEAKRRLQAQDQLVGILGHDLRNPLNVVMLSLRSLVKGKADPDKARATAERGQQAAERMSAMVQDILDFARASPGETFPIRVRPADLHAVAAMVVDEVKAIHPQRSIVLEAAGDLHIACDPDRIAQVMGNLVVNAVQHGEGVISVALQRRGDQVVLRVHNDGDPIPAEALPTLFEPFRKARPGTKGLGLGLHIVREIVRAHGGTVTAQSSQAQGTTLEVSWPAKPPAAAEASPRAPLPI